MANGTTRPAAGRKSPAAPLSKIGKMRDLSTVLQELSRRHIDCRLESAGRKGFKIALIGDSGEVASFHIPAEELASAGEQLWEVARQHSLPPLSRLVAEAASFDISCPGKAHDPLSDVDVLSYAVLGSNGLFETVWYANTRGEVREEVMARREGWRQSDRFRHAQERSAADFRRLFIG
jgi:hypothetical protein